MIQSKRYLSELIPLYTTAHALRSSSRLRLTIPGFHDNTSKTRFGARSSRSSAPALWNSLPQSFKVDSSSASFKRQLKTPFLKVLDSFPLPPTTLPASPLLTFRSILLCFSLKFNYWFILFTYLYIPPILLPWACCVHGALLVQYKWTVIIIITSLNQWSWHTHLNQSTSLGQHPWQTVSRLPKGRYNDLMLEFWFYFFISVVLAHPLKPFDGFSFAKRTQMTCWPPAGILI